MSVISERLEALRRSMKENSVDVYIITTDDFHSSEYVGAYFKVREFMSGFTGSAGTLVVMPDRALLWTDGRYFIQAEAELIGSTIELMKSGQEGTLKIPEFLRDNLADGSTIGFDGRTVSVDFASRLDEELSGKDITYNYDLDLAGNVWTDRPKLSSEPVWEMPASYVGKSRQEKILEIREKMMSFGADIFLISALDEIAWALNLRGNDIPCNPVFLSYMLILPDTCFLYVNEEILNVRIVKNLQLDGIFLKPYNDIYQDLMDIDGGRVILYDSRLTNYKLKMSIPKGVKAIDKPSPIELMKAVKTTTECENERLAHIKDGVAVTRFIYWLKECADISKLTELDAVEKLEYFRQQEEGYLGPSFDTIAAYGAHGAIVHYEPTEKTNIPLKPEGFLLVDSGGQYMQGTTDITRTIALGRLTEKEKRAYTLVLIGHLNLAAAKFLYGTRGENLDYVAREPLWRYGLDFNHGTGHGVGFALNVHEGPNRIHFRITEDRPCSAIFEEGMITSDEPGLYIEGEFGIRHENLLLCRKGEKNEYGQFMYFENLTWVPFDKDAIDTSLMSNKEIELLNSYHEQVYEKISPYLDDEERNWLREATTKI